ncbi:MAG: hypothetical protein IKR73_05400 [Oscillospiraceae bacterium]|nr:hypothetical protein [Oscillospiraceae bacterium]
MSDIKDTKKAIDEIDDMIASIESMMRNGTERLKVGVSDELEEGEQKVTKSYGRCAAGVCDLTETPSEADKE